MNKLSELYKKGIEKWKSISNSKKIAFSILFIGIIVALAFLIFSTTSTKYAVLFSNLEANDLKTVTTELDQQKVTWKASGNSISVPESQVDKLRLQLASSITNGSTGFELLDQSKFGETDQQMQVDYQRALQGELERTIKAFPEVKEARVHIVPSEDSAFVKDSTPASAAVTLQIQPGQKLTSDQVKGIVALLTGAVKNLPKENVQVIDQNMTLLSKGLYDQNNPDDINASTDKQQAAKTKVEKDLQQKIENVLAPAYKDVKVSVNADLNFDAVQTDSVNYAPSGTVVSEHKVTNNGDGSSGATSQSPVDNNMTNATPTNNTTTNANGNNTTTTTNSNNNNTTTTTTTTNGAVNQDITTNYNVSQTESKVVKAPGSINKISTSVLLNGNIDDQTKAQIKNLVISAIGYDEKRGDNISIEGMSFDTTAQDAAKKDLADIQKAQDKAKAVAMYTKIGVGAAAALILLIIAIAFLRKRRNKDEEGVQGIDVMLDDIIMPKEPVHFNPIELEVENEKTHVENEIKKYASEKPEQVADIIKSWLAEDEG